ncbi:hypothetical protein CHUAL_009342 [Chamberlinius hualienensis]
MAAENGYNSPECVNSTTFNNCLFYVTTNISETLLTNWNSIDQTPWTTPVEDIIPQSDVVSSSSLPLYIRINVTVFGVVILVVGLVGNLLVPLVVWRNRDMRNSTNFFLVNLSIADLLVLMVCMPTVLVEIHCRPEVWVMGEFMCKVVPFLELAAAHVSALTILAISIERYYAICKPLKAGYKLTRMRKLVIIISLWLFATLATSPLITMTHYVMVDYTDNTTVPTCKIGIEDAGEKVYHLSITIIFFLLPLLILVAIYTVIVRHLIAAPTIMGIKLDTSNMKARRQVVVMVGTVVVFFFICLLPFKVLTLWTVLDPDNLSLPMEVFFNLLFFCRIMVYINSAINPILYNLTSTKFRQAFLKAVGLKSRDRRHRLDRQTTFTTTYSSLYSSVKVRAAFERSLNGHLGRNNSSGSTTTDILPPQDSAV